MILQKRVKAGIMLYALLMLSVFSLLLQFYLNAQLASQKNVLASQDSTKAYLIAQLSMDNIDVKADKEVKGELHFSQGRSSYQQKDREVQVTVTLENGKEYQYSFPLKSDTSKPVETPPTKSTTTTSDRSSAPPVTPATTSSETPSSQ